jgi:hypothetical protein
MFLTNAMALATLFPDSDYRHHLGIKRGDLQQFFAPTAEHEAIMAERRRSLADSPHHYVAALDSAASIIDEFADVIRTPAAGATLMEKLIAIGIAVEPDVVLLQKSDDGIFRVIAGCVCLPSSWSLPEKLGMPLDHVHSVVPDLNPMLGSSIARFLDKMQPGTAWERANWGLSACADRNHHPARQLAPIDAPVEAGKVWLRVEDQILAILRKTNALVFGLRVATQTLEELRRRDSEAAAGLRRALATMPEEMARYKNISGVRSALVDLLA